LAEKKAGVQGTRQGHRRRAKHIETEEEKNIGGREGTKEKGKQRWF